MQINFLSGLKIKAGFDPNTVHKSGIHRM